MNPSTKPRSLRNSPDAAGFFGNYGGVFRLAKAGTWHEKRSDRRRRERRERLRTVQKATRKNDPNRRRRRRPGGAPKKR